MYKSVDVQTHPQARPLRSRRWILASVVIAAIAVISLLGTMTIRDRYSTRSETSAASPAAAQTQNTTLAELNEMWAAADAGFAGLEPAAAVVHVPTQAAAEPDAALWASVDHVTLTGG
jgi:hypothetical protein